MDRKKICMDHDRRLALTEQLGSLGAVLKERRLLFGISAKRLAELIGMNAATVLRVESTGRGGIETLVSMAWALKTTLGELCQRERL